MGVARGLLPLTRLLGFMVSAVWSGCGRGCGRGVVGVW